jgi:hypothetical protein
MWRRSLIGLVCLGGVALAQPVRRGVDMEAASGASFRAPMGFNQMREASVGMRAFQEQRRPVPRPVLPRRRS